MKVARILRASAVLWLGAAPALAGTVEWVGRPPESADQVQWRFGESAGQAADRAAAWLEARGYFWSRRTSAGDTLWIEAGPRAEPGEVRIVEGLDVTPDDVAAFQRALSDDVSAPALERAMRALVESQVERGRPFTQVRLVALDVSQPPRVGLDLAVYSGPRVYAGSLVTRALRTDPHVFEREALWRRGAVLGSELISQSQERLESLPYVASLDSAVLFTVSGDTADLYLGVRETPGVHAEGVLGYVPASSTDGFWTGAFGVELRSAFGDGRTIGLEAARPDPESQRTRVHFWEPWPFGLPLWLGADFTQDDFRRDYIETRASVAVRLASRTPRWQFGGGWGRVTLEEEPSASSYPAEYWKASIAAIDTGASASYRFEFQWSSQRLNSRDGVNPPQPRAGFTQGSFAAHRWISLSPAVHLRGVTAGAGTLLGSADVPSHLLYRVGGVHSLRGYREQEFVVRDYLRLAWEGHLGTRRQSLFAFVEAGWLNFQAAPDRIVGSAGLGLSVAGRVQLVAGVPAEGGVSNTKIHVSINTGR